MSQKKFTPDTESGRFVGFRLKKECPIEVYDKLNDISQSEISLGDYFTNLILNDLGISKNDVIISKEDISIQVRDVLDEELSEIIDSYIAPKSDDISSQIKDIVDLHLELKMKDVLIKVKDYVDSYLELKMKDNCDIVRDIVDSYLKIKDIPDTVKEIISKEADEEKQVYEQSDEKIEDINDAKVQTIQNDIYENADIDESNLVKNNEDSSIKNKVLSFEFEDDSAFFPVAQKSTEFKEEVVTTKNAFGSKNNKSGKWGKIKS